MTKPDHAQPSLPLFDEVRELLGLIAGVAMRVSKAEGRGAFAKRIGMSETATNHALNRTKRKDGARMSVMAIEKLIAIVRLPGGVEIVRHLASTLGYQLVAATPYTIEEELVARRQVTSALGNDFREATERSVKRTLRSNRAARVRSGGKAEAAK